MLREHPIALAVSILGHLVLIGVLVYNFDFDSSKKDSGVPTQVEPIKAVAVDEELIKSEVEKLKRAEKKKLEQQLSTKKKRERELAAMQKKRKDEEQRLKKVQQQRQREQDKLKQEKARREKLEKEQAAKLKKQREKEARKKAEAEKKRVEEKRVKEEKQAELERQKKEAEKKEQERVAALEQERNREEARIAEIEEKRLAALAAETQRKEDRRLAGLRAEYEMAIRQKVSRNWIKPDNTGDNVECTVMAQQILTGELIDVTVLSCTDGGSGLPRSVELAVRKASPLPLPKDPALFDRQLEFTFRPE